MIKIRRSAVKPPPILSDPEGLGPTERKRNEKLAKKKLFADMKFTAYADPAVRDALNKLFRRKCAYCESKLTGQPGDIEHYRPKGRVAFKNDKGKTIYFSGYYWLAADWDNLLLSCAYCNRPNRQELEGNVARVVGKADWFPLADEARRAKAAKDIGAEPRLLLNPCVDDPQKHLAFTPDGGIQPRKTGNTVSRKGRATIDVCGLDSVEFLQARAERARMMGAAMRNVKGRLARNKEPMPADHADLALFLEADSVYLAFIRTVVANELAGHRAYLAKLGL